MNEKKIDLSDLNMTDEELFAPVNHDELESERITPVFLLAFRVPCVF